jgi:hypothetical protein
VPEAERVMLALEVLVANGTYERVLPENEQSDPPVEVVMAVRSISSRERELVGLERHDGGWRGALDVPKSEVYGELTLYPMLVRTRAGDTTAFASHVGALVASGTEVIVEIDEPPVPLGGFLEINWDNFRQSSNPKRSAQPDLLYMLDTDRETPILWLNEAIGGGEFKSIMHAHGPRGYNLRIRDAMFDTIVSQVWTSLGAIAITNLAVVAAEHREANDDSNPVDELPEWHQRVISFWAPHLYGGSRADAIREIEATAGDKRLLPELFDKMSVAVQKWAGTNKAYHGLIRMRDREGV